ncbi:MAG: RsiV family protein [Suilimivivens sp.]
MHKRKETGKIQIVVLVLLFAMIFAGCGKGKGRTEEPSGDQKQEEEQREEETLQETAKETFPQEEKSCLIEEDSDYLYLCGSYQLLKINKATGEPTVLWENKKDFEGWDYRLYSDGQGFLFGDRIYFIEAYRDEESGSECKAFSVICTDGTGYQRLHQLDIYSSGSMVLLDDGLYVDAPDENGEDDWLCFQIQEDGSLLESSRSDFEELVHQGYSQMSYEDNGRRKLLMPEAEEKFGYLVLRDENYEVVKVDPKSGEEEKLPAELLQMEAYNEENFLCVAGNKLYLVDNKTLQTNKTIQYDNGVSYIDVIAMDEEYIYLAYATEDEGDHKQKYVYEKISLETYDRSVIFEQEQMIGVGAEFSIYLSDIVVKNGYLYYAGAEDYQLYMMRRSLENPSEEEKLGEAFYDSGIGEVGTIHSYHERTYSQTMPDVLLTETDLEWLQVDGRFSGADKINRYLEEEQNKNIEYESSNVEWMEEAIKEYGEDGISHSSYSSTLSEIAYFDGHYLSFCQQEYDYQGGAHGMPLWIGLTFDLETGERLKLSDAIGNSEGELNGIVTEYFAEYINENPEEFWEDALDVVRDEICFESDFYLTEDGIKFYFHPYALSYYAAGFPEVTIPYDEFEMKISLQSGEKEL